MPTVYDFDAQTIDGRTVPLRQYEGKVLLIVNTASACGFTPQFAGLEELHQRYGDQGLVVLGFPCNQFAGQDPGSNDEIASFCQLNYGVSFPMMAKVDVNGAQASPLYRWLCAEAPTVVEWMGSDPWGATHDGSMPSLVGVCHRRSGSLHTGMVARCHPHLAWLDWRGLALSGPD